MYKTTVRIDGMMCGMCETHINEAIRKAEIIKKVKSSHKKGEAEIISEQELDEDRLREAIEATGYQVLGITHEEYVKKGLFG